MIFWEMMKFFTLQQCIFTFTIKYIQWLVAGDAVTVIYLDAGKVPEALVNHTERYSINDRLKGLILLKH